MVATALALGVVVLGAQGTAGPLPLALLPCAQNLPQCAQDSGVEEFQALHAWLLSTPQQADDISAVQVSERGSRLELQAFQVIKDLGLTLLASSLDYVAVCQHSDPRCAMMMQHFQGVKDLRSLLDARLREIAKDYLPDPGVRSSVLRVGHSLRSDLDAFLRQLPTLQAGLQAAEASARLAQTVGLRGRMLAWHLGMHFWVRHLQVPGRGAPVLILHEEYTSFRDMVSSVVGMMVRNGQPQLVMMEVGVPLEEEWSAPALVRSVPGLQHVGIVLEPENDASAQLKMAGFEQLRAQVQAQATEIANRMALHFATSQRAAAAFPDRSLDVALLDLRGTSAEVAQEQMAVWESKVKAAGVLMGIGFAPESMEIVKAVCSQRFSTDLHLAAGGGFWWLVEPPEDEE